MKSIYKVSSIIILSLILELYKFKSSNLIIPLTDSTSKEKIEFNQTLLEEKEDNKVLEFSKDELMSIKGIGEKTAQNILDYIKENKPTNIDELIDVKGIGEAKLKLIKEAFPN
jgi:DNA uptake protein ComE-like DNA-binding protein